MSPPNRSDACTDAAGPTAGRRLWRAWPCLVAVAFSAVLHGLAATRWHAGYDEQWHVFFAEVEPLRHSLLLIRYDTHPPLAYLPLRLLTAPGDAIVWARIGSIVCSLASLPLVFLLLRRCGAVRGLAAAATLALGFGHTFVSLGVCVRSYAQATFFVLVTLHAAIALLQEPDRNRRGRFAALVLGTLGAAWSLYPTLFALVGIYAALAIRMSCDAPWRRRLLGREAVAAGLLLAAGAALLWGWYSGSHPAPIQGHLSAYTRGAAEGAWSFAERGLGSNLEQLAGVPAALCGPILYTVLLLAVSAAWWVAVRSRDAGMLVILAATCTTAASMCGLGLAGIYPWGGLARHQYLLQPLTLLVIVLALQAVASRGRPWLPGVLAACFVAIAGAQSWRSWSTGKVDEFLPDGTFERPAAALASAVAQPGSAGAIYVARYDQIGLYANARFEGPWRLVQKWRELPDDSPVFEYAGRFAGRDLRILAEVDRWTSGPSPSEAFARRMAYLFRATGIDRLWVLQLHPGPDGDREVPLDRWRAVYAVEGLQMHRTQVVEGGFFCELIR